MNYKKARLLSAALMFVGLIITAFLYWYNVSNEFNVPNIINIAVLILFLGVLISAIAVKAFYYKCPHCNEDLPVRGRRVKKCPNCEEKV